MFVKILKKNQKDGVKYYASLVENTRIEGKVVQKVLLYFGQVTEDQIPFLKAAYAKKKPKLVYDDGDVVNNEEENEV